jgi:hypothetical protein
MNKEQLQAELLKKIKPGIKTSDLKKKNNQLPTPPLTPPLKPQKETSVPPIVPEVGERDQSPTPQPSQSSVKQLHQAVKY